MAWSFINVSAGNIISSTINNYTPNVSALGSFTWSGSNSNISQAGTDIMTIATSTQQIFTTNRFTLKIKTVGSGCEIRLALDGTEFYTFSAISNYATNSIWLSFVIDEDTEHANMLVTWRDDNDISSRRYQTRSSFTNAGQQAQLSNKLYIALKSAEIQEYIWESVPVISGKMGSLRLPQLESVPNLNPVYDAEIDDFWVVPPYGAELRTLYPDIVYGTEQVIVWSGDDANASITWTDATHFTLKMYTQNLEVPFYTVSYTLSNASDEIFVAFLLSVEEGVEDPVWYGRPSFIFKNTVSGKYEYNLESTSDVYYEQIGLWLKRTYTHPSDDIWGTANDEEGGDGYAIPTDESIPAPALPTISSLNLNMTRMYKCTKDIVNDFWTWLCDDDTQIDNNLFKNDPLQAVVGLNICPVNIEAEGNPEIKFLGLSTNVFAPRVVNQFQEIDCGTCTLEAYMHNTYLDFAPFTKVKCVIPYVGAIELDPSDVMPSIDPVSGKLKSKKLHLKMRYDVLTGVCIAHIYVGNTLRYQAGGQINIPVPFTQKDYTEIGNAVRRSISNVAQSIAQASAMGAMTGGFAGAGVGIAGSMIASGLDIMMSKPHYTYVHAGAGASSEYLGFDRPFLLVEIPKLARPKNDNMFFGMPSYITGEIKKFIGFGKFQTPHIDNVPCTEREKDEIVSLLTSGIINQVGTTKESTTPSTTPVTTGNTVITFLKNKSERNVMGKTFATSSLAIEGKLIYDNSITTPVFLINGDVTEYNYCYIGLFKRFYYINDVVVKENGMCEVHLTSDPLQSFKADIKECKAICERSENKNNFYINDGAMIVKQDSYIFTKQFSKDGARFSFNAGNACYTLVLADA